MKYATVVIDPPWETGGNATYGPGGRVEHAPVPYSTMSLEEIAAIPVSDWLLDDAFVFLWTTSGYLPAAFPLLERWGLRYCFTMTWVKPGGAKPVQYPYYNAEYIVVGRRGAPQFLETTGFFLATMWQQVINHEPAAGAWGLQQVHSAKPGAFYALLARVTPGPRLDVFNRRVIDDFDGWGDEVPDRRAMLL